MATRSKQTSYTLLYYASLTLHRNLEAFFFSLQMIIPGVGFTGVYLQHPADTRRQNDDVWTLLGRQKR